MGEAHTLIESMFGGPQRSAGGPICRDADDFGLSVALQCASSGTCRPDHDLPRSRSTDSSRAMEARYLGRRKPPALGPRQGETKVVESACETTECAPRARAPPKRLHVDDSCRWRLRRQMRYSTSCTVPRGKAPAPASHATAATPAGSSPSDPSVFPGDPVRFRSRSGLQFLGDRREVVADRAGRQEHRACDLADGPVLLCDRQDLRFPRG